MKNCIGWTGPSHFDAAGIHMIETCLQSNPLVIRQNNMDYVKESLDACKAVIIAGGSDIHPSMYGSCVFTEHNLSRFDLDRDYREIFIIDYCLKVGKPMLGICRGHQMLGIYHSMEMVQDISDAVVCHAPKSHNVALQQNEPAHWVQLLPNSGFELTPENWGKRTMAQNMLKKGKKWDNGRLWVNSFHHQALRYNDEDVEEYSKNNDVDIYGYAVAATPDVKKIVELMGKADKKWLSCQWHPEYDWSENPCSAKVVSKFKEIIK